MEVVVITPPEPVVTIDQAKAWCGVTGSDDDDDLLLELMATATAMFDGPDGILGRALGVQTLELRLDSFLSPEWRFGRDWASWGYGEWGRWARPSRFTNIELPCPPFVSLTSITYEDQNGLDQILSAGGWNATDEGVSPSFGSVWPSGRITADAIRIRYQAGYTTVPAPLQRAILMLVSHWYNHRDAVVGVEARDSSTEMPLGVSDLIFRYRRLRV